MADQIKRVIAKHVRKHVMEHVQELTDELGMSDVSAVTIGPVTDLETSIRIKTPEQGIRHFTVKVTENWLCLRQLSVVSGRGRAITSLAPTRQRSSWASVPA